MEVQRNHKDRLFCMLFREKVNLLSLYNAVNGTHYTNEEDLTINTLENAIFMNMKNDVSFVFDAYLNMYEHQSTYNPNIPLRDLFYISRLLQNLVSSQHLYGTKPIKIPTPRFIVFYNGTADMPERRTLRLSELFEKEMDFPELELLVTMININHGNNQDLMDACDVLKEYSLFIDQVRNLAKHLPIREAVIQSIEICIHDGILRDFLTYHRNEAIEMCIFEYDEEVHMKLVREEGWEEGNISNQFSLIKKKLLKGFDISTISNHLELDYNLTFSLVEFINTHPDLSYEELAHLYIRQN